jgi:small subunit ribosomal protein S5
VARHQPKPLKRPVPPKGPREPNDITRPIPKIDLNKIEITDVDAEPEDDEWLDPLIALALEQVQQKSSGMIQEMDVETQLKMMDYFVSQPGSTEDLVGERRILSLEGWSGGDRQRLVDDIDRLVETERVQYLELPRTEIPTSQELAASETGGIARIPSNQLAHGDWYAPTELIIHIILHHSGYQLLTPLIVSSSYHFLHFRGEMLIRTDRVCKMWRGGRIESYRALVIGGNLRGCGGFGVGKAFEPEDAVAIAARMARRNIFFVDRYRNRSLTRDLMGRQNSCKVYLRATDNGLRGNPVACEILKLMGITNAVCKAHGNRNHYNVVRATFKALLTHESLDEIALKRGVRLINLQKAKRLQI